MSSAERSASEPRVYDCFTFAGEIEMLEFRLSLLDGIVDVFVIVEASRTFSGLRKPLFFEQERPRFATKRSELRYVRVDDLPPPHPDRWVSERFQRDAIARGLFDAKPADLIIVTDVDEIPDPSTVSALGALVPATASLEMRTCYYRGNLESTRTWPLARCARFGALKSPNALRESEPAVVVPNAGVHFSYLMTPQEIAQKYRWFAHAELDNERQREIRHVTTMMRLRIFAPSHELLSTVPLEGATSVQRALFGSHAEYFDFGRSAPSWLRKVGARWAAVRTRRQLPVVAARSGDALLAWATDRVLSR